MKQPKNKLIATLILGLTIAGNTTNLKTDAMFPSRPYKPVESYSQRISPDEREFNEIQRNSRNRTSTHNADRDRYDNVGSVGTPNSRRIMSLRNVLPTSEYVTKANTNSEINASKVIKETIDDKKFSIIATQAPMKSTINAFWDLILYSKHVYDIVVLGNSLLEDGTPNPNLQNYWSSNTLPSDQYTIVRSEPQFISKSANKTTVTITDKSTGKSKTVEVYNYHAWPDHGLPTETSDFDNFVSMFKDKRKLVVHCSAGVGRTGTFSACLEVLRRGAETANVRDIVTEMRTHRTLMVQKLEQYLFVKEYQRCHTVAGSLSVPPTAEDVRTATPQIGNAEASALTSSAEHESFFTLDDIFPATYGSGNPHGSTLTSSDEHESFSTLDDIYPISPLVQTPHQDSLKTTMAPGSNPITGVPTPLVRPRSQNPLAIFPNRTDTQEVTLDDMYPISPLVQIPHQDSLKTTMTPNNSPISDIPTSLVQTHYTDSLKITMAPGNNPITDVPTPLVRPHQQNQ